MLTFEAYAQALSSVHGFLGLCFPMLEPVSGILQVLEIINLFCAPNDRVPITAGRQVKVVRLMFLRFFQSKIV